MCCFDIFSGNNRCGDTQIFGTINIEELMLVNPDLVIIKGLPKKKNWKNWKSPRFPLFLEFTNVREQQQAMSIIGKAIGRETEAKRYNDYYQEVITKLQDVVENIPISERVKVYHAEKKQPGLSKRFSGRRLVQDSRGDQCFCRGRNELGR